MIVYQEESLVRDRIEPGLRDKTLQKQLLRDPSLILKNATEFIRDFVIIKEQLKIINDTKNSKTEVDVIIIKNLQSNNDRTKQY